MIGRVTPRGKKNSHRLGETNDDGVTVRARKHFRIGRYCFCYYCEGSDLEGEGRRLRDRKAFKQEERANG